ncbi:ABC transporter ATP-binding protein [Streptomyces sp. NPDC001922]|uniref:ABC transporter ATP-binding protein n=1 Tax=Streptomyces sp. NPDC001922 TaxID=3364624 RepID=UPI00368AD132
MTTVSIRGLTVRHRRTTALDAVDLGFGPGVHGLLGPNGAGKTSLIRVLATVAAPASGAVDLLNRPVSATGRPGHAARTEVRRRLGYLPQDFGFYPGFTVREFVAYVAWLKEMPGERTASAVERAVARVGLTSRLDAKVRSLSGGMVRRVGIAQAIVNDPELLLFDEPTAGLDPEQRMEFRSLLRELGTTATVIVSTHLVEDVAAACTEVTLLEAGRVAYRGTPQSLAALGRGAPGDDTAGNAIERGYSAALRGHRAAGTAAGAAATAGPATATGTAGTGAGR